MTSHIPSAAPSAERAGQDGGESRTAKPFGGNLSIKLLAGIILVLTFAAYARTLGFQFVLDDRAWLVENPALHSWSYLPDYFTKQVWAGVYPSDVGNYYRPAFMLWMRLNTWAFGGHPAGYHLAAVFLHLFSTLLVFWFALRISNERTVAAVAALVFGLHPIHIESVAWILGSTDALTTVFLLSSLLCWDKGRAGPSKSGKWRVASWLLFGIALLAKETAILFPLLIFVHCWVVQVPPLAESPLSRRLVKCLRSVAPFVAIVIPYLVTRGIVLHGFSHPASSVSWSSVFLTWPALLAFWLKHLVWPVGLSTYYDFPFVTHAGFSNFFLPMGTVLAAGALVVWGAFKSRVIRIAAAWLIVPIIPALDLRLFPQDDFAHDRFLYLSSVGFALIVGWLVHKAPQAGKRLTSAAIRPEIPACLLAALLLPATVVESSYLRDGAHLYPHNHLAAPENLIATTDLAAYLSEQGKYPESAALLEPLVRAHPEDWGATYILGHDYYKMNRLPEAVALLGNAITIDPEKPEPYLDLGSAWLRLQKYDNAERAFRRALELRPEGKGYHFALGIVLETTGRCEQALKQFQLELRNYPDEDVVKRHFATTACRAAK